jgi:hypothetical protein
MDVPTLVATLDYNRMRLLGTLDALEKSGEPMERVLAWRPGPGRAHIAWQFMHCAATHDRYLNVSLLGGQPKHPELVSAFAGGSTPADVNIPTVAQIRQALETTYAEFKAQVQRFSPDDLNRLVGPPGKEAQIGSRLLLLAWHEAHHQGQIHLTWNLYKAAHGISA